MWLFTGDGLSLQQKKEAKGQNGGKESFLLKLLLLNGLLQNLLAVAVQTFACTHGTNRHLPVQFLVYPENESAGIVPVGRLRRERFFVSLVKFDSFGDSLTKFLVDLRLVVTVYPAVDKTGAGPDIAAILFRPFDYLQIPVGLFHFLLSSIAA